MISPATLAAARTLLAEGDVSFYEAADALRISRTWARKVLEHLYSLKEAHIAFYHTRESGNGLPRPYFRAGTGQDARRPTGGHCRDIAASKEALLAANPFNLTTK